jgi:alkylation response protein AidB-like acyl-CoA dehydrogenase
VPHLDRAQRLFRVTWTPTARTVAATGAEARRLLASAVNRGALATAAELVGTAERLIAEAVRYAKQREQFGHPIGSWSDQRARDRAGATRVRAAGRLPGGLRGRARSRVRRVNRRRPGSSLAAHAFHHACERHHDDEHDGQAGER